MFCSRVQAEVQHALYPEETYASLSPPNQAILLSGVWASFCVQTHHDRPQGPPPVRSSRPEASCLHSQAHGLAADAGSAASLQRAASGWRTHCAVTGPGCLAQGPNDAPAPTTTLSIALTRTRFLWPARLSQSLNWLYNNFQLPSSLCDVEKKGNSAVFPLSLPPLFIPTALHPSS